MAEQPLKGKVAVVAGASRAIGMGSAVELAAAGAIVYALGRTLEPTADGPNRSLKETAQLAESLGGTVIPVVCDCTNETALTELLARVQSEQGRLDVLVNSVFAVPVFRDYLGKRFWEIPASAWRDVVDLGAGSGYFASVLAAPLMMATAEREGQPGLIVNISGRAALGYRYNVIYGVGKAATHRVTQDTAIDLRDKNVAVVSVWPNGHKPQPPETVETSRYTGRAVAALAGTPDIMERTGRYFWSAEVAAEFGFTDENGDTHPVAELVDVFSTPFDEGETVPPTR